MQHSENHVFLREVASSGNHIVPHDGNQVDSHHCQVGSTGEEGLPRALPGLEFDEEENNDVEVGEENNEEGTQSNKTRDCIREDEVEDRAITGQLKKGLNVTKEVWARLGPQNHSQNVTMVCITASKNPADQVVTASAIQVHLLMMTVERSALQIAAQRPYTMTCKSIASLLPRKWKKCNESCTQ